MRRLFVVLLVLFTVGACCPGVARALDPANQQITVSGVVLPARYIILDADGRLQQILSNTKDDVEPQVYAGSIRAGNQRSLTAELRTEYYDLLSRTNPGIGVLYTATAHVRQAAESTSGSRTQRQAHRLLAMLKP